MGYLSELLGEDDVLHLNCVSITWVGKTLCIQNYKKIVKYSPEKIVLKTHKELLNVVGKNLKIKTLDSGEIIVVGDISTLSYDSKLISKVGEMVNELQDWIQW